MTGMTGLFKVDCKFACVDICGQGIYGCLSPGRKIGGGWGAVCPYSVTEWAEWHCKTFERGKVGGEVGVAGVGGGKSGGSVGGNGEGACKDGICTI